MRHVLIVIVCSLMTVLPAAAHTDSLDIKIGQMIMVGIGQKTALTAHDPVAIAIEQGKIGGIVLFENNIAASRAKEQLKKLVSDCQAKAGIPLFISIDEEGGRVHRLKQKYGFIDMPSAAKLGRINHTDTTLYYNRKLAALLADLGINLNYAPAVDVAVNPSNPVIVKNERSFSQDPAVVTKHALTCITAHHDYGVKTILKHFPGHGSSRADSHLGIVSVTDTWKPLELEPYRAIFQSGNYDAVMTAHIINRKWEASMLPATLSKKVVTGMLREELGFSGVVFSDDMQMGAISKNYGFQQAIMLAINAGVDVLMFTNSVGEGSKIMQANDIHDIIKKLVLTGKVSRTRIDEAYRRIMALKNKTF